jgi:hypothetical protein
MYELSFKAILDSLNTQPTWTLTLSAGLDSRLIAGVAADIGADVHAFAWGGRNSTDVNYSRRIAQTLGIPWRHIELRKDFLAKYTPLWANLFGSAMAFHGMYQMCFLDALTEEAAHGPVISGFFGDVIAGDGVADVSVTHSNADSYQIVSDWYSSWEVNDLRKVLKVPYEEELQANLMEIKNLIAALPGAFYQKVILLECWSRQRLFSSFQAVLNDYWQGVATPFLNRAYARFCLSLPRAVMDDRRLLTGVFQRYYGRLAVIPGTFAKDPLILTGKYLILRRIADKLRPVFHVGPLRGFGNVQLRLDIESIQTSGKTALWPLFEMQDQLAAWLDIDRLNEDYWTIMKSKEDIRPLRRLQAAQTLAYRLIFNSGGN